MSDLSKVLGDLYDNSSAPSPAPASDGEAERRFQPTAPEWAAEERLDEAFDGWTPGPPAEAPAAEREMSVVIDTPFVPAARLDEDLAATLSEALVDAGRDNHQPDVPVAAAPAYELPGFDMESGAVEPVPAAEPYVAPMMDAFHGEPVAPVPPVAPVVSNRPWSRGDDDILPGKHHHVHVPKAKAAKAPKATKVKEPKAEKAPKAKAEPKKFFGLQLRK